MQRCIPILCHPGSPGPGRRRPPEGQICVMEPSAFLRFSLHPESMPFAVVDRPIGRMILRNTPREGVPGCPKRTHFIGEIGSKNGFPVKSVEGVLRRFRFWLLAICSIPPWRVSRGTHFSALFVPRRRSPSGVLLQFAVFWPCFSVTMIRTPDHHSGSPASRPRLP